MAMTMRKFSQGDRVAMTMYVTEGEGRRICKI